MRSTLANPTRVLALKGRKIEFMMSDSFKRARTLRSILDPQFKLPDLSLPAPERARRGLPAYLAQMYETRLLTRVEEVELFGRMNCLKYRADYLRRRLAPECTFAEEIDEIERMLEQADEIKGILVRANLRLVISIAKQFVDAGSRFDELVSDGNLSLIRAVEKFDYSLGNRFSTYATYAVRRNFYRTVIRSRQQRTRIHLDNERLRVAEDRHREQGLRESQVAILRHAFPRLLNQLTDREQRVISERFGFGTRDSRTFQELGTELGVCKERIRQIQARAIEKLRRLVQAEDLQQQVDNVATFA